LISSAIHDQKDSFLCWAFAICTMLASELRSLVIKLFISKNRRKETLKKLLLSMIEKLNHHGSLRNELILLVVPRSPKLTDENKSLDNQASTVSGAIEKICFESITKEAGWKRMPSLVKIFEILV
jgi:hypothetical protein